MRDLSDFVRRTAARGDTHPRLEDALLMETGRAYVGYRLRYLALRVPLRTSLHTMEVFLFAGVIWPEYLPYFFVLRGGTAVLNGLLWGSLEALRDQVRRHMAKRAPHAARVVIERWLGFGLLLLAALAVAMLAYLRWAPTPFSSFSILDAYAVAVFARLGMDVMGRIHHAGAFAFRRVYRPFWTLILTDIFDVGLVMILFVFVGPWAFAPALLTTGLVKHAVTVVYTQRTYRGVDGLAPRWVKVRPQWLGRTEAIRAIRYGVANLSGQLDAWVVLALATSVVATGSDDGVGLAALLHMGRPLLAAGTGWSRLFYFDFKRLGLSLSVFLRARFDRLLYRVAWLMGASVAVLLLMAAAWLPGFGLSEATLLLLGFFVLGRSVFGLRQLQAFVDGNFRTLLWQSAWGLTGLGVVALAPLPSTSALGILTATLLIAALPNATRSSASSPDDHSDAPLPLVVWIEAVKAVQQPVVIHVARVDRKVASPRQVARLLAPWLGARGRVAFAPKGHVVWFETGAPEANEAKDQGPTGPDTNEEDISVVTAGALASHTCRPAARGGQQALREAMNADLLPPSLVGLLLDTPHRRQSRAHALIAENPRAVLMDMKRGRLPVLPGVDRRALVRDVLAALRRAADGELRTNAEGLRLHVLGPDGPLVAEPRGGVDAAAIRSAMRHR